MAKDTDRQELDRNNVKIAVVSQGWVIVGVVISDDDEGISFKTSHVIRRWGTDAGLGQLVEGPRDNTILDPIPTMIRINREHVLFTIDTKGGDWNFGEKKVAKNG